MSSRQPPREGREQLVVPGLAIVADAWFSALLGIDGPKEVLPPEGSGHGSVGGAIVPEGRNRGEKQRDHEDALR